jgi:LysM repeat protein
MTNYIVREGDTLSSIATAHRTTIALLERYNRKITNPNMIYVNEVLALPPAHGPVQPRPAVTHAPVGDAPNPIAARAVAHANATHVCREGTCDHIVAGYYGLSYSGYNTAYENALAVPRQYRHVGNQIEAGMVAFWSGGSHHYGHAALFVDGGVHVRSSDMDANGNYAPGEVNTIPYTKVHESWGLEFMFATDPWFQGHLLTVV